jgi:tetratricopeptide (TPR) repeat protein
MVAVKMLLAGARASPKQLARFFAEAKAVAQLQHPNIVQIYEVGQADESPYFALEYVDGGSLADRLVDGPLSPRNAVRLVERLAQAMHYAHERGIIHRDLKPANILLQKTPPKDSKEIDLTDWPSGALPLSGTAPAFREAFIPKITDFGLAKQFEQADGPTRTGDVMGTPSYMAPEQAGGVVRQLGRATDVYALGAILYELLTGRPPFRSHSAMETMLQVLRQEPVPPRRLQPNVPRDLETICLKCLEKQPSRRYPTAEALADDLHRFLAGKPIQARPVNYWERSLKWARRRPAVAALLSVSALATVLLLVVWGWFTVQLQTQRDYAQEQQKVAEANFNTALSAVDKMLTEVAEEKLAPEPQMRKKQEALLQTALGFYKGFLQQRGTNPEIRKKTGMAHKRVADILRMLGKHDEAIVAYREAITLLNELGQAFPQEPDYRQHLADSHNWLGEVLRITDQFNDARAECEKARTLQEQLVKEFSQQPLYKRLLARSQYNCGILLKQIGNPKEARPFLDQAIALLKELHQQFPQEQVYRLELGRGWQNLGVVLRDLKQPEKARQAYEEAIGLLDGLTKADRKVEDYRHDLGVTLNNLGNLLSEIGEDQKAEQAHRRAITLFEELEKDYPSTQTHVVELANSYNSLGIILLRRVDWKTVLPPPAAPLPALVAFLCCPPNWHDATAAWEEARKRFDKLCGVSPQVADYWVGLGMAQGNLARLSFAQKQFPRAQEQYTQAIGFLKDALKRNAKNLDCRRALFHQYQTLAEIQVLRGDHQGAAATTVALAEVFEKSPDAFNPTSRTYLKKGYYYAAAFLSRCAGVTTDSTLKMKYTEHAVARLRQAMKLDGEPPVNLAESWFNALREDPAFKQLQQ